MDREVVVTKAERAKALFEEIKYKPITEESFMFVYIAGWAECEKTVLEMIRKDGVNAKIWYDEGHMEGDFDPDQLADWIESKLRSE